MASPCMTTMEAAHVLVALSRADSLLAAPVTIPPFESGDAVAGSATTVADDEVEGSCAGELVPAVDSDDDFPTEVAGVVIDGFLKALEGDEEEPGKPSGEPFTLAKNGGGKKAKRATKDPAPAKDSRKDWRGVPSGQGHSTETPPPGAEGDHSYLTEPWNCGDRQCATSQTWVDKNVYKRKVISQTFGRNKACAVAIPDAVWNFWCRKSYQTWTYENKHKVGTKARVSRVANAIRDQAQRFAVWRPSAHFIIALSNDAEKQLANYAAEINARIRESQSRKDGKSIDEIEIEAQLEMNRVASEAHAAKAAKKFTKKHGKGKAPKREVDDDEAEPAEDDDSEPQYPCKLLQELKETFCSTKDDIKKRRRTKTYTDIEAVILWAQSKSDNGEASTFPPVEFLMEFANKNEIPHGEHHTEPINNYQLWHAQHHDRTLIKSEKPAPIKRLKLTVKPRPINEPAIASSSKSRIPALSAAGKKRNADDHTDTTTETASPRKRSKSSTTTKESAGIQLSPEYIAKLESAAAQLEEKLAALKGRK
ncbi:hypothetical protein MBLNU230_g3985t1 [Neophaeotheca triangularis]